MSKYRIEETTTISGHKSYVIQIRGFFFDWSDAEMYSYKKGRVMYSDIDVAKRELLKLKGGEEKTINFHY